MGEVVPFRRPDPEFDTYAEAVRKVCGLAGCADWAERYIVLRRPLKLVEFDCIAIVFHRRIPQDWADRWRRINGRAGTRRRALPIRGTTR